MKIGVLDAGAQGRRDDRCTCGVRLEDGHAKGFAALDGREGQYIAGVQVGNQIFMTQGFHKIDFDF